MYDGIGDITKYIISVNFKDDSILDRQIASILPKVRKKILLYRHGYIKDTDIKDICKYIDFLNISESIQIYYLYK